MLKAERARGLDLLKEHVEKIREHGVGRTRLAGVYRAAASRVEPRRAARQRSRNTWRLRPRPGQMVGAHEARAVPLRARVAGGYGRRERGARGLERGARIERSGRGEEGSDAHRRLSHEAKGGIMRAPRGRSRGSPRRSRRSRGSRAFSTTSARSCSWRRDDYAAPSAAYDRCIARAPGRGIAEKCMIRKGDCLYYRGVSSPKRRRLRGIRRGVSRERARRRGDLPARRSRERRRGTRARRTTVLEGLLGEGRALADVPAQDARLARRAVPRGQAIRQGAAAPRWSSPPPSGPRRT